MRAFRFMTVFAMLMFSITFLSGCHNNSSNTPTTGESASPYYVTYIPGTGMNAPIQGRSTFQIRVQKMSDNSLVSGLSSSLTVTFLMQMNSGMSHATPVDIISESTTSPGYYNCTAYYMMASKDSSGMSMGTWNMYVTVSGETTTFEPEVGMAMGTDTVKASLYGANDVMTGMSSTSYNKYYLFRDGMMMASMPKLALYISHSENMSMNFTAASMNAMMTESMGMMNPVTSLSLLASLDNGSTWPYIGTDGGNGHWSFDFGMMSGLTSSVTSTVLVKMSVNGDPKTTDGAAPSGTNDYATFLVTPQ